MGLDVDYIVAEEALDELKELLIYIPHGERREIADEIVEFKEQMKEKWKRINT